MLGQPTTLVGPPTTLVGLAIKREEAVRRLMCACLGRARLETVAARSVQEAAALVASRRPDYLIVDEAGCSPSQWWALSDAGKTPTMLLQGAADPAWAGHPELPRLGTPFSPPAFVMFVRVWLLECGLLAPEPHPMPDGPAELILDVCSGSGQSTCEAADHHGPAAVVVGLDLSFEAVERARRDTRRLGYENLLWVVGDASRLPFRAGALSAVEGVESLPAAQTNDRVREEIHRVSQPGALSR